MLDKEKDKIIKNKLQKDKYISKQANDVFQNFYKMNSYDISNQKEKFSEENNHDIKFKNKERQNKDNNYISFKWKAMITIAASFVIVFSAGIAVYVNKDKLNFENTNIIASDEYSQTATANIIAGKDAKDFKSIIVKNDEISVDENSISKSSENDMVKAILKKNGTVAIQLKKKFMDVYKLNLDTSKYYSIQRINKTVKDVFVGYIENSYMPYVFLIMKDGTVECIQIVNGEVSTYYSDTLELIFYNQGQILGLENIVRLEQRSESKTESNSLYYYVVAINSNGIEKEIELGKYNDMTKVSKNKVEFTSQDGKNTYYIESEKGDYIQASGWAGASNNVYYINDNSLYHMSLVDGSKIKLVTGASKIWKEESNGNIIAKLDDTYTVINEDKNIILEESSVSQANIIDTKEDDNMIAYLHEDGNITIMFKNGGIQRITKNSNNIIKENIKYKFSFKELLYTYPEQEFKATAIYVGKIGAKGRECFAFGTSNNKFKMFDVAEYLEDAKLNNWDIKSDHLSMYIIDRRDCTNKITSIEPVDEKIRMQEDNSIKNCTTLKWYYDNGKSEMYPSLVLMLKDGFYDENGIGHMEVINQNNNTGDIS